MDRFWKIPGQNQQRYWYDSIWRHNLGSASEGYPNKAAGKVRKRFQRDVWIPDRRYELVSRFESLFRCWSSYFHFYTYPCPVLALWCYDFPFICRHCLLSSRLKPTGGITYTIPPTWYIFHLWKDSGRGSTYTEYIIATEDSSSENSKWSESLYGSALFLQNEMQNPALGINDPNLVFV